MRAFYLGYPELSPIGHALRSQLGLLVTAEIARLAPVINPAICKLYSAVTTDRQTGKIFSAQFNPDGDSIPQLSFDSQSPAQTDEITIS
jgi:hypothetical protein